MTLELKFLQLNLNRAELAQIELLQRLNKDKVAFVSIQEPYTYKNKLARKPVGFDCFPSNQTNRPRTALFVKKRLKFNELSSFTNIDTVAAIGKIAGKQTVVASVYLDITSNRVIPQGVDDLVEFAKQNGFALILSIDSNAHSDLYGRQTNKRGEAVEDFIMSNNLKIENVGLIPTFESSAGSSIIDITLTLNLPLSITGWAVEREYNGSDHNTIVFSMGREKIVDEPHRPWGKADWMLFRNNLKTETFNVPEFLTDKKLDRLVEALYKKIEKALDAACPLTKANLRDANNKWFDERIEALRVKVVDAYRRRSEVDGGERLKRRQKKYKTACRRAKRKDRRLQT